MNVHLLDGLFLEAHEMKKEKEMYLDIVVGEMQDEYFFLKGEHFVYFVCLCWFLFPNISTKIFWNVRD